MRQNKSKQSISAEYNTQKENRGREKRAKSAKSFPTYTAGYIVPCHTRIIKICIREIHTAI